MNVVPYSNIFEDYIKENAVIDYKNEAVAQLAETLFQKANNIHISIRNKLTTCRKIV